MEDDVARLLEQRRYGEAFERMLDRYSSRVFRMAAALLRDAGRAEEVTQDVFMKVWQALPDFDHRAAASTWLYTIARNTCFSAMRSQSYRRTVPLTDVPERAAPGSVPRDVDLEKCLTRLPALQRQVIILFYFEDRTVEDVAEMLALPAGTVKSHLHRARRALGEMLE